MYIHTWLTARGSTTKQTEIGANTNMAKTYLDSAVGMFFYQTATHDQVSHAVFLYN